MAHNTLQTFEKSKHKIASNMFRGQMEHINSLLFGCAKRLLALNFNQSGILNFLLNKFDEYDCFIDTILHF